MIKIDYTTMNAMEARVPFSWLRTKDVQIGTYFNIDQDYFHKYELEKRMAAHKERV